MRNELWRTWWHDRCLMTQRRRKWKHLCQERIRERERERETAFDVNRRNRRQTKLHREIPRKREREFGSECVRECVWEREKACVGSIFGCVGRGMEGQAKTTCVCVLTRFSERGWEGGDCAKKREKRRVSEWNERRPKMMPI